MNMWIDALITVTATTTYILVGLRLLHRLTGR